MGICASKQPQPPQQPQPQRTIKLNQLYDYVPEVVSCDPIGSCKYHLCFNNHTMRVNYENYRQYLYELKYFIGHYGQDDFGNRWSLKYTKLLKDGNIEIRRTRKITRIGNDYQIACYCCTVYPIKTDYIVKKLQRWRRYHAYINKN